MQTSKDGRDWLNGENVIYKRGCYSPSADATLPLGESGPKGPERVMRFANNLPSCTMTAHPAAIASDLPPER